MLKANLLRQYLTEEVPFFRRHPESLTVYAENGHVEITGSAGRSFRYHYPLNILVLRYPDALDTLIVPLTDWLRRHQPELLFNPDWRRGGIVFDADILDDDTADILLSVPLSERVFERDGQWVHRDEPDITAVTDEARPEPET